VPRTYDRACTLFDGVEPVVNGRIMWQRLKTFDFAMEPAEGVYEVHIDLRDPGHRPAMAWKAGETQSVVAFELVAEGSITARGWITNAAGRRLAWEPTHDVGFEYVVFAPGGPRLITVSAAFEVAIGGNPGHMLIAPEAATDPQLPALVALGFALACEQALRLHWDARRTLRGT
jgi:hypothetical protein